MPLNATGMTQNAAKMTQNATHLHFILRLPNLGFPVEVVNLKPKTAKRDDPSKTLLLYCIEFSR